MPLSLPPTPKFSAGLAFIPGPEAYLCKALVIGAQQSPCVAKALFPVGTADSQLVEMQDISNKLGDVVKQLQNNRPRTHSDSE